MKLKYTASILFLIALNASAAVTPVASARFGIDWAQVGESTHLTLLSTDQAPDHFDNTQETSSRMLFGAFLGAEFPFMHSDKMRWQSGLAYYQPRSFETEGVIYFFSLPNYGDKSFQYSVKNQRVLFENKFLYKFHKRIFGYLLAGLGANFNTAYGYEERSIDPQTPADGMFESNRETSFSYSLGLGADFVVNKDIRLGLGYQYTDLGNFSFGNYNNGDTNATLSLSNIADQELVFSINMIF